MYRHLITSLLTEFFPVIGFFFAVQLSTFFVATQVLMGLTLLAVLMSWFLERRVPTLPLITAGLVTISGSLTLVYQSPDILILGETLYYVLFGSGLWLGLAFGQNLLKRIFDPIFAITNEGWRILIWRWIILFFVGAVLNELVRIFLTPEAWVVFKLFKTPAITLFALYQLTLSRRYRLSQEANAWGFRIAPPPPRRNT